LLFGAEFLDHRSTHVVDGDVGGGANAASSQRLKDQGSFQTTETRTTVLLVHVDASEALFGSFLVLVLGEVFCLVPFSCIGSEFSICELVSHILDHHLVLVKMLGIH